MLSVAHPRPSHDRSLIGVHLLAMLLVLAVASISHAQTVTTLTASSCVSTQSTFTGACSSIGNTPLQTGTGHAASNQIVLHGQYTGYQVFTLPSSIPTASVTGLQVKANYQGPSQNRQNWTWKVFDWVANAYVTVGSNSTIAPALDWVQWTIFDFSIPAPLTNFIRSSDRQIRVQISSNNAVDDTYIDYEAVLVTSGQASAGISILPTSVSLPTGASVQFAATVTGSTNTSVTWQVNNITGGGNTVGTISATGLYTSPATAPSPATVTVKAIAQADTSKSATASVTVTSIAEIPTPLHGITVADDKDIRTTGANSYLSKTLSSLSNLSVTPTVRLVYTQNAAASTYLAATQQLKSNRYIMGMPVDSSSMPCYTNAQHQARWQDYIATLGNNVDIWEVGNEINGSWLFGNQGAGCSGSTQADVATKMTNAYNQAKAAGKATALTLFFNVDASCAASDPQMINWASTYVPASMKSGLDYVFVSFYPQWCTSNPYLYAPDWNSVFATLRSIFPNAKLGMGEIGWDSSLGKPGSADLVDLVQTGYRIKPTSVSNWVGGGFYWEFGIDAVPYSGAAGSVWATVNNELAAQ